MASEDDHNIFRLTLAHYERSAEDFRTGTQDHDVSQNITALLRHISGRPPFHILDFGCGPGRDIASFLALGHRPVGLDGCASFVAMARAATACEVLHQDFFALQLPDASYDGVFANASLFHVPSRDIARVLAELRAALKPGGVLFCSNPRGEDQEGWQGERFGVWYKESTWRRIMHGAGFEELESYYRPAGLPRERQPWFASIWRKSD